jgi:DNA repair ATPase RecN
MKPLYEISNEYQAFISQLDNEENMDKALDRFGELSNSMNDKCIALASYIKNLEAEHKAIEEAKYNMEKREERVRSKHESLLNYLKDNMERCEITHISSSYFDIKIKKCPESVDITDENLIPDDCKKEKYIVTLDRAKMQKEMKQGVVIPGARLIQKNRIEIK